MTYRLAGLLPLLLVAACDGSTAGNAGKAEASSTRPVSRADPRLPAGFTLFTGGTDVVELEVGEPSTGGKIFTYSITTPPREVIRFYERQAAAAGMSDAGSMNGAEILSYEARKAEGAPRTFGVTALQKGTYTNVTLNFDVTP